MYVAILLTMHTAKLSLSFSGFVLLGPEGCKAVWHQLRASEKGHMLQGIECESFSSVLICKHDQLFNDSEKEKLHSRELSWQLCADVVEEALKRNPVDVVGAFYKALIDTQDSGGASQHAKIAEVMTICKCLCIHTYAQIMCECTCIVIYVQQLSICKCLRHFGLFQYMRIGMYPVEIWVA